MRFTKYNAPCIDYLYLHDLFDDFSNIEIDDDFVNEQYISPCRLNFDFWLYVEKILDTEDTEVIGNFIFELYKYINTPVFKH